MLSNITLLYIALFAPLVGSLFSMLFSSSKRHIFVGVIASLLLLTSLGATVLLFVNATLNNEIVRATLMDWIVVGHINLAFGFVVDGVSATMMLVVTLVSSMVHIYAIGYMLHDRSFNRFFTYLSAFVFSMLILVMSDNFMGLFIGWEGVGLCSWMLIGFWYEKESANFASNEAFIMNRIADLGMLLGIFLLFWVFGTLRYEEIFDKMQNADITLLTIAGILLFIGAMGKSAQFPLHTWLADAMEGPTPVSALIHAATMVTAGVYLVIRANPLYSQVPELSFAISCLGAFVALFAAFMALVNRDLKRIIAYSTLSQLGYMFVAAGLGAYWIALFHLMTHAFFKSLLFLGAGNVMHAMHNKLDILKMGALYKPMKVTAILMILASIALAGIFPFAGFFSKDKILESAFAYGYYGIWVALMLGAFLTAFYSFRLIMLVFFAPKNHEEHPHEAYSYMLGAMTPLAVLAVCAGWFESDFHHLLAQFLPVNDQHLDAQIISTLIAVTSAVALSGIIIALFIYRNGPLSKKWEEKFIYKLLFNQYYIPLLYEKIFMVPYKAISHLLWKGVELKIIDASVDLVARILCKSGEGLRPIQSGNLSKSLRLMAFGLIAFLLFCLIFVI
ncbi:NADH-quinone oxidoreductase subunit L [Helicobacter monodelphidis]|uniref:NADH-quinone oxidoreductase subunit L n=1 Tax=Helicobacter sp. 15-1451 TaxID=2004995 RepID=UPI000DCD1C95|nr:NADH-quinone oxidoreductase subunit L [Helicobacter sp. 15-1451]RAX59284.1 NADH-quinone oxidoreductase subunit L [Helicobacter sp. 15-1451]